MWKITTKPWFLRGCSVLGGWDYFPNHLIQTTDSATKIAARFGFRPEDHARRYVDQTLSRLVWNQRQPGPVDPWRVGESMEIPRRPSLSDDYDMINPYQIFIMITLSYHNPYQIIMIYYDYDISWSQFHLVVCLVLSEKDVPFIHLIIKKNSPWALLLFSWP